ncbi:MAG: sensor histidine kinase [Dehalococcoidia bacterium]
MKRFSIRVRLIVGLMVVVAVGLGVAEIATYYSVQSFMLARLDEQVEAASGPAVTRLLVEDRFGGITRAPAFVNSDGTTGPVGGIRGGGPLRGVPEDLTASLPPGTYAEVRFADGEPRATTFGFGENYPIPALPEDLNVESGTKLITVNAIDSSQNFRVSVSTADDRGATLLVAVPMTEYDKTMDRLRLIGGGVTLGVLILMGGLAFLLVKLGLKPLDHFAMTAGNIAAGDMTQRMPVENPHTEIGRLGTAMNEMLDDLEEAFARRDRSEEQLRRFLADASHELRTPLTSIRGYAELFGRGASGRPQDLETVMRRISQQSERMSDIVEDLLLLARFDGSRPLELEPVDLGDIAADVVEDARQRQPDRTISFEQDHEVVVTGDSHRLYQVVSNLVTNALTHTPHEAPITVQVKSEDSTALLEVRDGGPGIRDEDRPHVFEPFYRAAAGRDRKDGGSGLGLAIVKAIVEAHDGSVDVNGVEPHGAAFSVRIPATAAS